MILALIRSTMDLFFKLLLGMDLEALLLPCLAELVEVFILRLLMLVLI